jgi:hypothetical protein
VPVLRDAQAAHEGLVGEAAELGSLEPLRIERVAAEPPIPNRDHVE